MIFGIDLEDMVAREAVVAAVDGACAYDQGITLAEARELRAGNKKAQRRWLSAGSRLFRGCAPIVRLARRSPSMLRALAKREGLAQDQFIARVGEFFDGVDEAAADEDINAAAICDWLRPLLEG